MNTNQKALLTAGAIGLGVLGRQLFGRSEEANLLGQVVVITGGSRGLGLLLAREFAQEGCRIAICARDPEELYRARKDLERRGAKVLTVRCDVTDRAQVQHLVDEVKREFGRVDILVNNAGRIQVGPVETMGLEDFEEAMAVMFWGAVYPTLSVLPEMLQRKSGRIVNITSIGGKVSMPHLLPYNCAKFATVGFSEGLRAEVSSQGVKVITIAPGLMRTGSYLNAQFKGDQDNESAWFGLGSTLPLISMSAVRAARQIVRATKRGESVRVLSTPASLLARFHGLFPGVTADLLGAINRLLPEAKAVGKGSKRGADVRGLQSPLLFALTILGRLAARRFHQTRDHNRISLVRSDPLSCCQKAGRSGKES